MMDSSKKRIIWLTDTHLYIINRHKMLNTILNEKPHSVFLTGDISTCAFTLFSDLEFFGKRIGRPLYFVLGNHDIWGSGFANVHSKVKEICSKYRNLIWMTNTGISPLTEDICIIGADGWYDAKFGNNDYLKYTFDWFMIDELRRLPNMRSRIEMFRQLAEQSAIELANQLEQALVNYKTIYLLTHVPPWKEANRSNGWLNDAFYEAYNTNYILGVKLEEVMAKHKKRHLVVLSGHCHCPITIFVAPNLECRVGRGSYYKLSEEEKLII